ncbi:hypothetical protein [Paramagnetospirillum marisnigri]|uniref:hypothetical protein n=1 Tax=Paramagnetospirillum marisnigri TaxID=1285242 RepID=UPI0012E8BBEF|nr:hypothetical protein [Paramagnetospirillum marisnigri]
MNNAGWKRLDDGSYRDRYRWNMNLEVYQQLDPSGQSDELAIEFSNNRGIKGVLIWGSEATIETVVMPLVHGLWTGAAYDLPWDHPSNPFLLRRTSLEFFWHHSIHLSDWQWPDTVRAVFTTGSMWP